MKKWGAALVAAAASVALAAGPAHALDAVIVSGPSQAAQGSTVTLSIQFGLETVSAGTPELRVSLLGAGSSGTITPSSIPAGVSGCQPDTTGDGDPLSVCDWTYPGGGADVTVEYTVDVADTAPPGQWIVRAVIQDSGNPLNLGELPITITAATPTTTPTPSVAPTTDTGTDGGEGTDAPVPTAVPAGAAPADSSPLLPGALTVAFVVVLGVLAIVRRRESRHH